MAVLPPAVHRTTVVVDVAAFGDRRRRNLHQAVVRGAVYQFRHARPQDRLVNTGAEAS